MDLSSEVWKFESFNDSKKIKSLEKKVKKYEEVLISFAAFEEGEEITSSFDNPGDAAQARKVLGKKICNKYYLKK